MKKVTKAKKKALQPLTETVEVKNGEPKEIPISDVAEIQDGVMPTNVKYKEKPPLGYATIGLALGATINVGDYQSARIDVLIQRNVKDDDEVIRDEYKNMSEMLQTELERQSAILLDGIDEEE